MARFTRAELESFRDTEVPDLLGRDVRLLFVGINPGLWTAATQTHFAHPVQPLLPGAVARPASSSGRIDAAAGMNDADRDYFRARGLGITNLARRATARADELTPEELRAGGERLRELVTRLRPARGRGRGHHGLPPRRSATGRRWPDGSQRALGEAELWVVPNPSGLNAHHTVASLAVAYAEPARAAGILD